MKCGSCSGFLPGPGISKLTYASMIGPVSDCCCEAGIRPYDRTACHARRPCKRCSQQYGKRKKYRTRTTAALTSGSLSDTGTPPLSEHSIDDPPSLNLPSTFLQVHPKPFLPHTPPSSRCTNTTDHVRVRGFRNNAAHWLYLLTTPYAQPSLHVLTLIGSGSRFVPRFSVITRWDAH